MHAKLPSTRSSSLPGNRLAGLVWLCLVAAAWAGEEPVRRTQRKSSPSTQAPGGLAKASMPARDAAGRVLNLSFETGTLDDWTATGNAFEGQPVKGDSVAPRLPGQTSRHVGQHWMGGFEPSLSDAGTGTLVSAAFPVTAPWASFLIGGGDREGTRVEIVRVDRDQVIHTESGCVRESMHRVHVDLSQHLGAEIRLRLVDEETGAWGHINFDDFQFHPEGFVPPAMDANEPIEWFRVTQTTSFTAPGSSSGIERAFVHHALPTPRPWYPADEAQLRLSVTNAGARRRPHTLNMDGDPARRNVAWVVGESSDGDKGKLAPVELTTSYTVASRMRRFDPRSARVEWDDYPVPSGIKPKASPKKDIALDFETGGLSGWTVDGEAFRRQPVDGDTVAGRLPGQSSQHEGRFWIGGYETTSNDRLVGTLTSDPIKVTHPWASFLIGGGATERTRVEILLAEGGKVIHRSSGSSMEPMVRRTVDLRPHQGKRIQVRLVDESTEGWGHLNFDDFVFHESQPEWDGLIAPSARRKAEQTLAGTVLAPLLAEWRQLSPPLALRALNVYVQKEIRYDATQAHATYDAVRTLEVRRGHCGHSTGLVIVAATALGIPVRDVAGLNLYAPDGQGELSAIRSDYTNIHTWAEAWFPGHGWVEFEPGGGANCFVIPARYIQNNRFTQNYALQVERDGVWQPAPWIHEGDRWRSAIDLKNTIRFERLSGTGK